MGKKKLSQFKLGKAAKREFIQFLEYHPAKRVNRHLRIIWMHFLENTMNGCPPQMEDIIYDINDLMELFDVAEDNIA